MSKSKKKNGNKKTSRYSNKSNGAPVVNNTQPEEVVIKKRKKRTGFSFGRLIKQILIWALLIILLVGMSSWIFAMFN